MKAGDTVHDSISGDDLVLAWYDPQRDEASWLGWPEGIVPKASTRLTVTESCSEADSLTLLRELAEGDHELGVRRTGARAELERWAAAHPFESADYYDTGDPEELDHETVEGALEYWLDGYGGPGSRAADDIRSHAPVTVVAYRRQQITPLHLHRLADDLAERAREQLSDDFGGPEGDLPGFSNDAQAELAHTFEVALVELVRSREIHSWQCEEVARRTYSAEEVEAILRASAPEWFEDEAAPPVGEVPA